MCVYIYICIHTEREREREIHNYIYIYIYICICICVCMLVSDGTSSRRRDPEAGDDARSQGSKCASPALTPQVILSFSISLFLFCSLSLVLSFSL